MNATSLAQFDAIVAGERWRLATGYVRAGTLGLVRGVLGEAGYARLRGYRNG
jgi:hypothetical protein